MGKIPRPPGHVTADEAGALVGASGKTIRDMATDGLLPAPIAGGYWALAKLLPAYIKAMQSAGERASVPQAAQHIGLSERRFRELLERGVIARQARHQYNLEAVRLAYIEHLRNTAAGRGEDKDASLAVERARLASEQADAQAMRNAAERGELLPKAEVHLAVTAMVGRFRQRILSLPTKVAPLVLGLSSASEVKAKLTEAVNDALNELASTIVAGIPKDRRPNASGAARPSGLVPNGGGAADTDG